MILRVFYNGEFFCEPEETPAIGWRQGPLFCEIDFVGDGTPGVVTFFLEPREGLSAEQIQEFKARWEKGLEEAEWDMDLGGAFTTEKGTFHASSLVKVPPWTPRYFSRAVGQDHHEWIMTEDELKIFKPRRVAASSASLPKANDEGVES